jgi:hypothetical protein
MELLKPEEVAKLLKCSVAFVYRNRLLLGGLKIGKLVRFQLNKIKEVIYGRETREVEIRLYEGRNEIQERRIQDKNRSNTGGSRGSNRNKNDKYGLLETLQFTAGGRRNKKE